MSGKDTDLPEVFTYLDFREYLQDYYQARKKKDPRFSHAKICSLLGQTQTRGYFNNVLKGRVRLGPQSTNSLIKNILNLDAPEANYFRNLVHYAQATDPEEKEYYFDHIIKLNNTPKKLIDKKAYDYFGEMHHVTLRSLLDVVDFPVEEDPKKLARLLQFPATTNQIIDSLELLRSLELIEEVEQKDGGVLLKPTNKVITTGEKVREHLVKKFQIKSLEQGKHAVTRDLGEPSRTSTMTVSISGEAAEKVLEKIRQLQAEIRSIAHKDQIPATDVYQINLQIYPQTKAGAK